MVVQFSKGSCNYTQMPPEPLDQETINKIAASVKEQVADAILKKSLKWIIPNLAVVAGLIAMSVMTYQKVQGAATGEQLNVLQKDIKKDFRTLINHTVTSASAIVDAVNNANVKDLKIDGEKVLRPLGEAKADLSGAITGWDDLQRPAQALAFRRGNEIVFKIVRRTDVYAPTQGSVIAVGSGTVRMKGVLRKETSSVFSVPVVLASNSQDREVSLKGLTEFRVKAGQTVKEGEKIGEVAAPTKSLINELSLEYSKAGSVVLPDEDLPIYDRGQEVFFTSCHGCHGSAKLVTSRRPGTPSLCGLGTSKRTLKNGKQATLSNIINVINERMPEYHENVDPLSSLDIESAAKYITRQSPAWHRE